MSSSHGIESQSLSSRPSPGRIPRHWLPLARGAWGVCALLLLANFVASIPAYYQLMRTVCPLPNQGDCTDAGGQLTAKTAQILAHPHLSLTGYAVYFVTLNVVVSLLPWGVGLLLFWRKSDERMGLFVSLLFVLFGACGSSNTLLGLWMPAQPSPLFSILLNIMSGAQWIGIGAFLLTFPTGRIAPRWSWLILSCWVLTFVVSSLSPSPQDAAQALQDAVSGVTALAAFSGTLFILVYRYRRVFKAAERQQTKWAVYAAVAALFLLALGRALPNAAPVDSPYQLLFPTITIMFPTVLLFLGLGFAMLRYRLWDIDAIINKTLVYGTLTALLTLTYAGVILLLQALARALTGQAGDEPVLIIGSTLLIAALFNPLRRRIQTFIDSRFYRRKYDAAKILEAFNTSLRTEVDLTDLHERLIAVVEETMQPAHVSLWLRPPQPDSKHEPAWRVQPLHDERGEAC